ncbi:hypothetical protein PV328_011035 [Microctonus aethiopoides]|uniref:Endonuclease/exonuclease/phosphatase domain-containing protein n=1 Tax=Microctonus aethiopoides TaxID=144406 RepID=A0AA39ESW2_9HYME|nr:hypothetical protein PV328_011035 [Microctonus aethiopoides]
MSLEILVLPFFAMKQTIIILSLHEPVDYCEQPVILAGDLNVNFSLPEAEPLFKFLDENFSLEMINGRHDPTTNGGTVIDAVFARDLPNLDIKHLISYFSFHNPIVNIIDIEKVNVVKCKIIPWTNIQAEKNPGQYQGSSRLNLSLGPSKLAKEQQTLKQQV